MNRDIGWLVGPLVAGLLFALVLWQTVEALHLAGAWSPAGATHVPIAPDDPLALLDKLVVTRPAVSDGALRDPFTLGAAPASTAPVHVKPVVRKPVIPPPPERPQLTAIVWDAEPRALVRWQGREWTLHAGGLFDEFQVISISRDQVVLKRGDENIVLTPKPQGE